jgi:hypothetical protein
MRDRIAPITAKVAQDVGPELWQEVQQAIAKARTN